MSSGGSTHEQLIHIIYLMFPSPHHWSAPQTAFGLLCTNSEGESTGARRLHRKVVIKMRHITHKAARENRQRQPREDVANAQCVAVWHVQWRSGSWYSNTRLRSHGSACPHPVAPWLLSRMIHLELLGGVKSLGSTYKQCKQLTRSAQERCA